MKKTVAILVVLIFLISNFSYVSFADMSNVEPDISLLSENNKVYDSIEEAGMFFREQMLLRNPDICIPYAIGEYDLEKIYKVLDSIYYYAIAHTGKGNEGEYLRLSIRYYDTGEDIPYSDGIVYYNIHFDF